MPGTAGYLRCVNEPSTSISALLDGHPGELVHASGRTLVWRGRMTPTLLAGLMRAGSERPVRVERERGPEHAAWIQRCWFEPQHGRMVVHLVDRRWAA